MATTTSRPTTRNTRLWVRTMDGDAVRADLITNVRIKRTLVDRADLIAVERHSLSGQVRPRTERRIRRDQARDIKAAEATGGRWKEVWGVQINEGFPGTFVATGPTQEWAQQAESQFLRILTGNTVGTLAYSAEAGCFETER